MTNALLQFIGRDPRLALLLTLAVCAVLAGVFVGVGMWLRHRQRRRDERFEAQMRANLASTGVHYPPAKGPKGFERQRRAS